MSAPDRAFVFSVEIGADTREGLAEALNELATQVSLEEINGGHGVSGGPTRGWIWALKHDPAMTHKRYFELLARHNESLRCGGDSPPEQRGES